MKSLKGRKITVDGKVAFVVNETEDAKRLKIVYGIYDGYTGWYGPIKTEYRFDGKRVWIDRPSHV